MFCGDVVLCFSLRWSYCLKGCIWDICGNNDSILIGVDCCCEGDGVFGCNVCVWFFFWVLVN